MLRLDFILVKMAFTLRADTSQTRKRKRTVACGPVSVEEVAAHRSFSQGNVLNYIHVKCV